MKKIQNAWSRHGWKMFGTLAILNIKHYCKKVLMPGMIDVKSSVDEIPGVETNLAVYLSSLGYKHDYGAGGYAYEPVDEDEFIATLHGIPISPSDYCFVDLGSGKGRALLLAAKAGFNKVIGVEFSEDLHLRAKKNIEAASKSWPNTNRIQTIHGDAGDFNPPSAATVLYLYNPFDAAIMSRVLKNWEDSMSSHTHDIWVMYGNPTEVALFRNSLYFQYVSSVAQFAIFRRKINQY